MKNEFPAGTNLNGVDKDERTCGVIDLLMPKDFHVKEMIKPLYLVCIEMTHASVSTGIFDTILTHVQSCIDSIQYDAKIGIVTYNHTLTFYTVPDDLQDENVKRTVSMDSENPFCALSEGDLYISISQERDKIDYLVNHLHKLGEALLSNHSTKTTPPPINIDHVIATASQSMEQTGGKVLIFGSSPPFDGKGVLKISDIDDGKKGKLRYSQSVGYVDK